MKNGYCKLSVVGLGVALGGTWALGILLMGLAGAIFGYGTAVIDVFGAIYIGYKATLIGSVIGSIWAFIDGFICGAVIALIYNCMLCCVCGHCEIEEEKK